MLPLDKLPRYRSKAGVALEEKRALQTAPVPISFACVVASENSSGRLPQNNCTATRDTLNHVDDRYVLHTLVQTECSMIDYVAHVCENETIEAQLGRQGLSWHAHAISNLWQKTNTIIELFRTLLSQQNALCLITSRSFSMIHHVAHVRESKTIQTSCR